MDVSPRELRDTDIREAFRGYHRDDVDELLERAAATIEGLSERVRQVGDRIADAESTASRSREAEETLQRTLVLAQRTADEAVADAQKRARKMLDDAETRARTVVDDAEAKARTIAETERRRLESEVLELAARRDALLADVDALDRFEAEYRQRLRSALEAELETLGKAVQPGASRPSVHDVELPAPPEAVARSGSAEPREGADSPDRSASRPAPTIEVGAVEPFAQPAGAQPEREPARPAGAQGAGEHARSSRQERQDRQERQERQDRPDQDHPSRGGLGEYVPDEPVEAQVLDDDAFFASLREAVRDDAPLGPRDDIDLTSDRFEQEHEEAEGAGRRRFRRRR